MKKKKKSTKEHRTSIAPTATRPGTVGSTSTSPAINTFPPTSPSTTPGPSHHVVGQSCKEINDHGESRGDGEYWIDPNDTGNPFTVYCDMTTDSGGWTLIKRSYLASTNPNQEKRTDVDDYRAISNYRDIGQNILTPALKRLREDMGFNQIRFRCRKKRFNRTLHIMTTNNSAGHKVLDHFLNKATWPTACNSFKMLADDTSELARNCHKWGYFNKIKEVNRWGRKSNPGKIRIYNNAIVWENKYYLTFYAGGPYLCDDSSKNNILSAGDFWELYVR